jgi:hypothetical protein
VTGGLTAESPPGQSTHWHVPPLQLAPPQHSTDALQGPKPGEMQLHAALLAPVSVASMCSVSPLRTGEPILVPPVDTQTNG